MRINILIVMMGLLLSVPDARSTGIREWVKKSMNRAEPENKKIETKFDVVIGDITKQDGMIIVNAANPEIKLSPDMAGVTKAIADAADNDLAKLEQVIEEAKKDPAKRVVAKGQNSPAQMFNPGFLTAGSVLITKGNFGDLGKRNIHLILHAVAPFAGKKATADEWRKEDLQNAYMNALKIVSQELEGTRKIAFPLLGAGVYGWPKEEAIHAAIEAIKAFAILKNLDEIRIVVLTEEDKNAVEKAFNKIKPSGDAILRAQNIIDQ
jgi:O-acetyl-ADP-ribose deacetylase (regulator of RNase III)